MAASGVTLSTENTDPVADGSDEASLYTQTQNSVLVRGILSKANTPEENRRNANTVIFARAYIRLTDGSFLYSATSATYLQQLVETIDAQAWNSLTDTQKTALQQMYETYRETIDIWNTPNLKASA